MVRCEWVMQDMILGSVGFVLIRCGKTCRHRNDCHEERSFYSHRSLETGGPCHGGPRWEAPGLLRRQMAKEGYKQEPLLWFPQEGLGEAG